jgi:hypothetical protein
LEEQLLLEVTDTDLRTACGILFTNPTLITFQHLSNGKLFCLLWPTLLTEDLFALYSSFSSPTLIPDILEASGLKKIQ